MTQHVIMRSKVLFEDSGYTHTQKCHQRVLRGQT